MTYPPQSGGPDDLPKRIPHPSTRPLLHSARMHAQCEREIEHWRAHALRTWAAALPAIVGAWAAGAGRMWAAALGLTLMVVVAASPTRWWGDAAHRLDRRRS